MPIIWDSNPADWPLIDAIYVDEVSPPASIVGVGTGTVGIVSQFDWGAYNTPISIVSSKTLTDNFGFFSQLEQQLYNLEFSALYVVRAAGTGTPVAATSQIPVASANFTMTAKYTGLGGNYINWLVSDATSGISTRFKLTLQFTQTKSGTTKVGAVEVYDEVDWTIADGRLAFVAALKASSLIVAPSDATGVPTARPANSTATTFFTGGTSPVPNADAWNTALNALTSIGGVDIVASDQGSSASDAINVALYSYAMNNNGVIAITAGANTVNDAVTGVASIRSTDGRVINISAMVNKNDSYGTSFSMNTQLMMASTLSMTPPYLDPAFVDNSKYFAGVTSLADSPARGIADYIRLNANGICAVEADPAYGFKFINGVTTTVTNYDNSLIYTRRMKNFLIKSVAKYLINFQNAPNTVANRLQVKGAMISFIKLLQQQGMLPVEADSYDVDVVTGNTPEVIARNEMIIIWKQKLIASARFIVLQAQIGQSVVVKSA